THLLPKLISSIYLCAFFRFVLLNLSNLFVRTPNEHVLIDPLYNSIPSITSASSTNLSYTSLTEYPSSKNITSVAPIIYLSLFIFYVLSYSYITPYLFKCQHI